MYYYKSYRWRAESQDFLFSFVKKILVPPEDNRGVISGCWNLKRWLQISEIYIECIKEAQCCGSAHSNLLCSSTLVWQLSFRPQSQRHYELISLTYNVHSHHVLTSWGGGFTPWSTIKYSTGKIFFTVSYIVLSFQHFSIYINFLDPMASSMYGINGEVGSTLTRF